MEFFFAAVSKFLGDFRLIEFDGRFLALHHSHGHKIWEAFRRDLQERERRQDEARREEEKEREKERAMYQRVVQRLERQVAREARRMERRRALEE